MTKRWYKVILGSVLLALYGLIYAWSIFIAPLEAEFGWVRSETSLVFAICMTSFCLGGLLSGKFIQKISHQYIFIISAICMFIGFFLSSNITMLAEIYIFYGIVCGFGIGLGYNASIDAVSKWFPDKQGFISGLLLMAFGTGSMIFGTGIIFLFEQVGWRQTFRLLSYAFFVLVFISAFFVKAPTKNELENIHLSYKDVAMGQVVDFTPGEMIRTGSFWLFMFWTILLSSAGLTLVGHASPLALEMGVGIKEAAFLTGAVSLCNGLGRVICGYLFDILPVQKTMFLMTSAFILAILVLLQAVTVGSYWMILLGGILAGLSYGGTSTAKSTVAFNFYGTKHYAANFSIISLNLVPASYLGPYFSGILKTLSGTYTSSFLLLLFFVIMGLLCNFFLKSKESTCLKKHKGRSCDL